MDAQIRHHICVNQRQGSGREDVRRGREGGVVGRGEEVRRREDVRM